MKKLLRISVFAFFILLFLGRLNTAFAGTFQLTKIGSLDTNGANYSHWWYTQEQPHFYGSAMTGAKVNVTVDSTSATVDTDSSGNWGYIPSSLSAGDHQVTFTSNGSTIQFTLTIGEGIPENIGQPAVNQTPVVGTITPTLAIIIGGILFLLCGIHLAKAKAFQS